MCTRLRGLLFLLPSALAVAVAVADANAALEPAGWGDLDGWAGDDHASAFATFYASCRPIVRVIAFRAESANSIAARNRFRSYPSEGEALQQAAPP
jgi:hypothetical protein